MEVKDYYFEAIKKRTSRRAYDGSTIDKDKIEKLNKVIDDVNKKSKLNIKVLDKAENFLKGFKASYGIITGVNTVVALVGNKKDKDIKEKVGYYGEFIMLEAVSLGLGTCWVGGSYNKKKCIDALELNNDEELVCIIVLGNVKENKSLKEKIIGYVGSKKPSFDELLLECDIDTPEWVKSGISEAMLAPSARNLRTVGYSYRKGELSSFIIDKKSNYEEIDIGISMAHFKIGAFKEGIDGIWERKREKYIFTINK